MIKNEVDFCNEVKRVASDIKEKYIFMKGDDYIPQNDIYLGLSPREFFQTEHNNDAYFGIYVNNLLYGVFIVGVDNTSWQPFIHDFKIIKKQ